MAFVKARIVDLVRRNQSVGRERSSLSRHRSCAAAASSPPTPPFPLSHTPACTYIRALLLRNGLINQLLGSLAHPRPTVFPPAGDDKLFFGKKMETRVRGKRKRENTNVTVRTSSDHLCAGPEGDPNVALFAPLPADF